ncbi:5230_t:CDS:2 [Dentiscutata erythropus]|uniref:5230_t:CDS:1 n=1 Tax=Dentiscutata erythropus TaxID=1348616 RepID=A0A9N8VD29_9GLOM|nr:5230_t:CDS:2 [Dentiscutata erythropus]
MIIYVLKISRIVGLIPDRAGHVAVIVENKLVFIGGSHFILPTNPIRSPIRLYDLSDEVFYLDLSSQFYTSSPPYIDLSNTSARMKFGSEKGTAVLGEASGNKVYLIGGMQQNLTRLSEVDNNITITLNQTLMIEEISKTYNMTDQFVFFYTLFGKSWSYPLNYKGTSPTRRRSTSTVIDQNGIIYIFGGRVQVDTGSPTFVCYNDLYTLDTVLLSWNKINAVNAPSPRSHAAPVLLPNGKILYIGGVSQTEPGVDADLIDMNEIPIFDTISSTWSYKYANQSIRIQPRLGHTATLTPDNNEILIIGGNTNYHYNFTITFPIFVSLNITKEPYEYSELVTSGEKPPPIAFHTANLYQNYLFIAFDIKCKTWATTFTPGISICSNESSNGSRSGSSSGSSSGSNINIVILVGVGGFALFCFFIGLACYLWIKNKDIPRLDGREQPK